MAERRSQSNGAHLAALRALDLPNLLISLYALLSLLAIDDLPWAVVVMAALVLAPGMMLGQRPQPASYYRTWNVVTVMFIGLMMGAYLAYHQPAHLVLVVLCLFLSVHRWFNPRGLREHLELWCLSTLLLLIGCLKGSGLIGILALLGWSFSSLHLLSLQALFRLLPAVQTATTPYAVARESSRAFLGGVPFVMLLSALFFFLIPRLGNPPPQNHSTAGGAYGATGPVQLGFSEVINLTSLSNTRSSDTVAFEVLDSSRALALEGMRFRVTTLDDFNGWEWRHLRPRDLDLDDEVLSHPKYLIPARGPLSPAAPFVASMSIRIVHLAPGVVPLPEATMAIAGDGIPREAQVILESNGRVKFRHGRPISEYRVVLNGYPRDADDFRLRRGPVMDSHLQVPEALREAMDNAARGYFAGTSLSPREKARHLETIFRRKGVYTLGLGDYPEGPEAVERFLGELRGHCELFATAYALILRSEGIPARLVTGFSGGQRLAGVAGPEEGKFVVRERDAHSWVEAWTEDAGWVAYDPTPAAPLAASPEATSTGQLKLMASYGSQAITGIVTRYDYATQQRILRSIRSSISESLAAWEQGALVRASQRFRHNFTEPRILLLTLALLVVNLLALMGYDRFLRGRRRRKTAAVGELDRPMPRRLLLDIAAALQVRGRVWQRGQSARELLLTAAPDSVPPEVVERLAALYNAWRFGSGGAEAEREIMQVLRTLRSR